MNFSTEDTVDYFLIKNNRDFSAVYNKIDTKQIKSFSEEERKVGVGKVIVRNLCKDFGYMSNNGFRGDMDNLLNLMSSKYSLRKSLIRIVLQGKGYIR